MKLTSHKLEGCGYLLVEIS